MKIYSRREWRMRILFIIFIVGILYFPLQFYYWEFGRTFVCWMLILGMFTGWPDLVMKSRIKQIADIQFRESFLVTPMTPRELIGCYIMKSLHLDLRIIALAGTGVFLALLVQSMLTFAPGDINDLILIHVFMISTFAVFFFTMPGITVDGFRIDCLSRSPGKLVEFVWIGIRHTITMLLFPAILLIIFYVVLQFPMTGRFKVLALAYPSIMLVYTIWIGTTQRKKFDRRMQKACEAYADLESHHPVKN